MFRLEMDITAFSEMISAGRALRFMLFCMTVLCFTPVGAISQKIDADKLPMYGQPGMKRPEDLKKADEAFVRDTAVKFGSRLTASRVLTAQGWAAVRSRNFDL